MVTKEERDALSPVDSWVTDSIDSFYTIAHREIMENYFVRNYGKIYLANREPMDILGAGDVSLRMSNRFA